jgi:hypothetical protein
LAEIASPKLLDPLAYGVEGAPGGHTISALLALSTKSRSRSARTHTTTDASMPPLPPASAIDRTIRQPEARRPDPRPGRERFFRHEAGIWVLAVVEFGDTPAIIVTVFSADQPPVQ